VTTSQTIPGHPKAKGRYTVAMLFVVTVIYMPSHGNDQETVAGLFADEALAVDLAKKFSLGPFQRLTVVRHKNEDGRYVPDHSPEGKVYERNGTLERLLAKV